MYVWTILIYKSMIVVTMEIFADRTLNIINSKEFAKLRERFNRWEMNHTMN